jgi:hypothetical protein
MMTNNKLSFSLSNAKLTKKVAILSLPAGHACPGAKECLAKINRETGKIEAGKDANIRCFATTPEGLFRNVRDSRWRNLELLLAAKTALGMSELIERSIPPAASLVRPGGSGDFFNQNYFDAWMAVARKQSDRIFYAYTKSLPYWVKRIDNIPENFHLVASWGGKWDYMISTYGLRNVKVVWSDEEAKKLKLPVDHDDSHCWNYKGNFLLRLHGIQPKGSPAGKAWEKIKRYGGGGYKSEYFAHYAKFQVRRIFLGAKKLMFT